jgi:hypothetical protein
MGKNACSTPDQWTPWHQTASVTLYANLTLAFTRPPQRRRSYLSPPHAARHRSATSTTTAKIAQDHMKAPPPTMFPSIILWAHKSRDGELANLTATPSTR